MVYALQCALGTALKEFFRGFSDFRKICSFREEKVQPLLRNEKGATAFEE